MPRLPFSLFKQGTDEYEVKDSSARDSIASLSTAVTEATGDTGWVTLNADYSCTYRKVGKLVELRLHKNSGVPMYVELGTIPEGFRPIGYSVQEALLTEGVTGGLKLGKLVVGMSGLVYLQTPVTSSETTGVWGTITYFAE